MVPEANRELTSGLRAAHIRHGDGRSSYKGAFLKKCSTCTRERSIRTSLDSVSAIVRACLFSRRIYPWRCQDHRTFRRVRPMSALPPKADIAECGWHVRFVPKADSCSAAILSLFDHLVGTGKYCRRNGEAECFCDFKIDHQLVLAGRLHR